MPISSQPGWFYDRGKAHSLKRLPCPADLASVLRAHLDALAAGVTSTEINRLRADILQRCREAAGWEPGVFSLNVPTGGGKTLSSLAFGLERGRGLKPGIRRHDSPANNTGIDTVPPNVPKSRSRSTGLQRLI
jgi:hypothetical protein